MEKKSKPQVLDFYQQNTFYNIKEILPLQNDMVNSVGLFYEIPKLRTNFTVLLLLLDLQCFCIHLIEKYDRVLYLLEHWIVSSNKKQMTSSVRNLNERLKCQ